MGEIFSAFWFVFALVDAVYFCKVSQFSSSQNLVYFGVTGSIENTDGFLVINFFTSTVNPYDADLE